MSTNPLSDLARRQAQYDMQHRLARERSESLGSLMDEMIDSYRVGEFDNALALTRLTRDLRAFAGQHFTVFYAGFRPDERFNGKSELAESDSFPPAYAFDFICDQVSNDLEVIQRAAEQRQDKTPHGTVTNALRRADSFAGLALQLALDRKLIPDREKAGTIIPPPLITYLQKSASTRVIPYSSIGLIGIPLTTVGVPADLLAIPHEVGHYVYWQGCLPPATNEDITYIHDAITEEVLQALRSVEIENKSLLSSLYHWREEIFADVYGTLVAGPAFAESAQRRALTSSRAGFTHNDDHHPPAIIRPYIHLRVLERQGNPWADRLKKVWAMRRRTFKVDRATVNTMGHVAPINEGGDESNSQPYLLDKVIDICLDALLGTSPGITPTLRGDEDLERSVDELLGDLKAYLNLDKKQEKYVMAFNAQSGSDSSELWHATVKSRLSRKEATAFFAVYDNKDQAGVDVEKWRPVLHLRGWTTGPDEEDPHVRPFG